MKKIIVISITILSAVGCYYFLYYLPHEIQIKNQSAETRKLAKFDIDIQKACSEASEKLYLREGNSHKVGNDYECHHNKKLNKCFMVISNMDMSGGATTIGKTLVDVYSHQAIGDYTWHNPGDKKYWEITPTWSVQGEYGEGEDGWVEAIRKFMEG